jgi:hypothetical protein
MKITESIIHKLHDMREECKKKNVKNATFEIFINTAAYDQIMGDVTQYFPPVKKELKESGKIYGMNVYLLLDRHREVPAKFIIRQVASIDPVVNAQTPVWP